MPDKLALWKQALIHLQKETIATLTDDVESCYVFANAWNGVVLEAFNEGDWNFAKKSVQLAQSGTGTLAVGWSYVFDYPADYIRTIEVSSQPNFNRAYFVDYVDENGFLSARTTTVFLRYISNEKTADNKVSLWPPMFWRYVAAKLAYETCGRLTSGDALEQKLEKRKDKTLRQAKSVDARQEKVKQVGPGSWMNARTGFLGGNRQFSTTIGGDIQFDEGDV
jgi:hypothetical protein